MSSKISALPVVTTLAEDDILTGLQGGVNVQMTRKSMLTGPGGEFLRFVVGTQWAGFTNANNYQFTLDSTSTFGILVGGSPIFFLSSTSDVGIIAPSGGILSLQAGSAQIAILPTGHIDITPTVAQTVLVGGFAGSSADWSGDPADVWAAIYRLATAVAGLLGGPIP